MRLLHLRARPIAAVVATALALCATACSTRAAPPPDPERTTKIGCAGGTGSSWLVPVFGGAPGQAVAASARIGTGPCGFVPTGVVAVTSSACVPVDLVVDPADDGTAQRRDSRRGATLPCLPRPAGDDAGVSAAARAGITWRTLTPGATAMTDTPPTKPLPDLPDEPIPTPMPTDPPTPQPGQPSS